MSLKLKFALSVAGLFSFVIYMIGICVLIIWFNLTAEEQAFLQQILAERIFIIMLFTFMLLIGLVFAVERLFIVYTHATRLHEETRLILTANPNHRITPAGPSETRRLAAVINSFADRHQDLQTDVETRIQAARADLEEEKDILAALMSELTQGVLVCNIDGQVLLYNNRARQLLSQHSDKPATNGTNGAGGLVGLGRSIFAIIDRNIIAHALDNLHHAIGQGHSNPVSHFVTSAMGGQLIRVSMAPVRDKQQSLTGFVLTMEDITRRFEVSNRKDILTQSLVESTRSSLANIRAAIENILEYPDMGRQRLTMFTKIIREEAIALGAELDKTVKDSAEYFESQWSLENMHGSDLISAVQRRFETKLGVATRILAVDEMLWLKIDSYSVVQALTYIMSRLRDQLAITQVSFRLERSGRFVRLDLIWEGTPVEIETLRVWEHQTLVTNGEGIPLTLKDVADRHRGEVWCQAEKGTGRAYFRLLLPISHPDSEMQQQFVPQIPPSRRLEYYDFDLFNQPGQKSELDERPLTELTYTIFDTETTGLNPAEGDEIIAIGAVRCINGRLLRQETMEQLIDPRRRMSQAAINIHGISPDMLEDQPTIDQILPRFYNFAEDTVLVAHNAAFDMRFLQMKEEQTGIKFIQPVLDTLLLSAVVHPTQSDHSLDAIAQRLGIKLLGRHTALGDAIVTGEVFLKLIPLLAEQGIHTLKEAREAAQQTYYALIEY
jgi:DNA polymerase-3 subunit epsilon